MYTTGHSTINFRNNIKKNVFQTFLNTVLFSTLNISCVSSNLERPGNETIQGIKNNLRLKETKNLKKFSLKQNVFVLS